MPEYEVKPKNTMSGEIHDVIIDKDGNRRELPVDHNLIVSNCSVLLAQLLKSTLKNDPTSECTGDSDDERSGIKYWAIGDGDKNGSAEAPSLNDLKLQNEYYRQYIKPADIVFLTSNDAVSESPTNRLRIRIVVDYDKANMSDGNHGPWTEFSIFAGPDAKSTKDSGIMINRKVHDPIYKSSDIKVERTLIFTF